MEPIISFCILYPGLKSLNLHLIQNFHYLALAIWCSLFLVGWGGGSLSYNKSYSERKESKMKTHNFILDTKLDNLFYIMAVLSLGQYFMICIHYFSNFTNPNLPCWILNFLSTHSHIFIDYFSSELYLENNFTTIGRILGNQLTFFISTELNMSGEWTWT